MYKGKLIVIEGIDGSGKSTQVDLLMDRFKVSGKEVKTMHFPQHGKFPFGLLVSWYLKGIFGDPVKKNPKVVSIIYALDRWQAKSEIKSWLKKDYLVVLDRYSTSNMGHQLSKIKDDNEKQKFLNWLEKLEYSLLGLTRPDYVLFINIPPERVVNLMEGREAENDGHENNLEHLQDALEAYKFVAGKRDNWHIIDVMQDDQLLTPNKIHDKFWEIVHQQQL